MRDRVTVMVENEEPNPSAKPNPNPNPNPNLNPNPNPNFNPNPNPNPNPNQVRIYRGSIHAYEPYEFGREENLLWLHLVKLAAEVVISTLKELPNDDRRPFQEQVSHISQDLKLVMERREQGLDEDWSEDALSAEEEVLYILG